MYLFSRSQLILELKFRGHLPAVFKGLIEEFKLVATPASKYRFGMTALGDRTRGNDPFPQKRRACLSCCDRWSLAAVPSATSVVRLVAALAMGALVAVIYKWARSSEASSFTATLVFLAILIAMVTQVIGDNIARAFSLVGALSIVRFRTVVRDTQDTAYVIFAVAVGMAVGAGHMVLALAGTAIVALAAAAMKRPARNEVEPLPFRLLVRLGLGLRHRPDGGSDAGHPSERPTSRRRVDRSARGSD